MFTKLTNDNKAFVIDQYFEKYSKQISYQQIWEEYQKYFKKHKSSYKLEDLEKEIRQNCPTLFNEEKQYASSVSSSVKF